MPPISAPHFRVLRSPVTVLIALFALLLSLIILWPTPASATNDRATKTMSWVLPGGGTAENVTWPQALYTGQEPACGESFTLQNDIYKYYTPEQIALVDSLDDDGVLTKGEDYPVIKSWTYSVVEGPECQTLVTPATPTYTPPTCDSLGVITAPDTTDYSWVWNEDGTLTAQPSEGIILEGQVTYGPYELEMLTGAECESDPGPTPPPAPPTPPTVTTYDGYDVPAGELG